MTAERQVAGLGPADVERIAQHGLEQSEVERQLQLLRSPPAPLRLERACRLGDGIQKIDDAQASELFHAHARAAAQGRFLSFVPASGAASRMFRSLFAARDKDGTAARAALERKAAEGNADARDVLRVFDALDHFAFTGALTAALSARNVALDACLARGELAPIVDAILDQGGLAYAETPKGLLLFHRYGDHPRTPFEEHLIEASAIARDRDGKVRLHFTVSPEHLERFSAHLDEIRAHLESRLGVRFDVGFSFQKTSTDTVAVDLEGAPVRDSQGNLLFRPGGHGALLENLNDLDADLIYVKNIDNIVPDHLRESIVRWRRVMGGRLVALQDEVFSVLRDLDAGATRAEAVARGLRLLAQEIGVPVPPHVERADLGEQETFLRAQLERPIRVCGVVPNEGDPGGAPFWVRGPGGEISAQIVETAQIDATSEEQRAIHASSTHFNPADMVLGIRDHRGRRFDLRRFVDRDAVFIAEKSSGGRDLRSLEHPGLWNGGMAGWITLFIEAPRDVFHPVKTLSDLLGPAHQPPGTPSA